MINENKEFRFEINILKIISFNYASQSEDQNEKKTSFAMLIKT